MAAPARTARLGGRRRFMPRKPLARRTAPFPQQPGYGRELRAKGLTKDGGIARGHRLRRCIFEGFSGQRDAVGMALTTAVAAGTAERSRRRRRGRSGRTEMHQARSATCRLRGDTASAETRLGNTEEYTYSTALPIDSLLNPRVRSFSRRDGKGTPGDQIDQS